MRLALDASAVIYAIEGDEDRRAEVLQHIGQAREQGADFVVSNLVRVEVRVKPIRENDAALLERYDAFLATEPLIVAGIDDAIIDRATLLRARHGFRTPDAIHLATAIELKADAFLTGDAAFARCRDMKIALVAGAQA